MLISPSVILQNIPIHLWNQDKAVTAAYILGSKTGVEVGVCYWKLHPMHPSFMVVFKYQADRDNWFESSAKLKELVCQGVSVSLIWYSRDIDKVFNESEGRTLSEKASRNKVDSFITKNKGAVNGRTGDVSHFPRKKFEMVKDRSNVKVPDRSIIRNQPQSNIDALGVEWKISTN